jgi:hypothetical protein
LGKFVIMTYEDSAAVSRYGCGRSPERVAHTSGTEKPVEVLLPLKFGNFDKMRGGEAIIAVANQPQEAFTAPAGG